MALSLFAITGCKSESPSETPESVFAPWDGTWKGRFRVKGPGGEVLTELLVEQRYVSESEDLQRGFFEEVNVKTGEVTTATAVNTREDGKLICRVEKSTGEKVRHEGTWTGDALVWSRDTEEAKERFVERIITSTAGTTWYEIRGWGEYDGGPRLRFEGRYQKQ